MSHSRCGAAGVAQQVLHSRKPIYLPGSWMPQFSTKYHKVQQEDLEVISKLTVGTCFCLEQQAASRKQEAKTSNERQDGLPSTPPPPRGHHQKGALDIIFCETQRVTLPEIFGPSRYHYKSRSKRPRRISRSSRMGACTPHNGKCQTLK